MHRDLEVIAPIIIGSIPLRSSFSNLGHGGSEYQQQESGNPFFQAYPDLRRLLGQLHVLNAALKCSTYSAPPSYGMANFGYEVDADVVGGEHGGSTGIYSLNISDDSDEEGKVPKPGQGYAPRYLTYGSTHQDHSRPRLATTTTTAGPPPKKQRAWITRRAPE